MKKTILVAIAVFSMIACKKEEVKEVAEVKTENFKTFGDSISADGVISKEDLLAKYETLKEGDTIEVKFRSDIKDVCQKKGCWMNMSLNEDKNAFVRFKDYGFFMPLNAAGSEAIVNGKAFISVETVDELKHYAKDAGKSQAAIDSITEPKVSYSFLSNGVLIKE
ncbi:DUF4920 domain-containing protein [Flavobacterium azooxidireducens]|uniref:DUF4920 domain-containing protein n=1 Tax=Flavobacterium azooxidireducens TaxID=1871076 RepID=A0ABY4KCR8_9FLAO|nr:DUF4920 domain-containing protein [Flavobacterium azooxidireducens]UPQ78591.1 DUF4920 domain-containing protein [Flavobacterium azooxidireducens]